MNAISQTPLALAASVAAANADSVDKEGVFPHVAFETLKYHKLLTTWIPRQYGGESASMSDIAGMCFTLGQNCSSTGLIFAMHQIEVAMLLNPTTPWHEELLYRVVEQQMLLASVTSEEGIGGSVRTSACAVEIDPENNGIFALSKKAPAISYGQYADGLLVTARTNSDAAASDQVLITILKDQYVLKQVSTWDTMGMRGTCSHGFELEAKAGVEQISPLPFGEIAETIMLPVSHLLWSSTWLGIATDALQRARTFLRINARKHAGSGTPPSALRLADAQSTLQVLHSRIKALLCSYEQIMQHRVKGEQMPLKFITEMNSLKVTASEMALHVVDQALMICGMVGYKHGTPYTLSRHLRDIHSSRLMVSNDRILSNTAGFLLAQRSPLVVF